MDTKFDDSIASAVPELSVWPWPLDIAYPCTKFENSSLSRTRDMVGAHQNLNNSRDLTTPLSGMVCHPRTSTCYDQPICQIRRLYLPNTKI